MANYKPKKKKKPTTPSRGQKTKSQKMTARSYWIIGFMIVALIGMIVPRFTGDDTPPNAPKEEPKFVKEGTLSFINGNTGKAIKEIDIEVADTPEQRQQGLMWRKNMEENHGMLFIMEKEEQQGFYMRNTYIPLDILFVKADKTILNIHHKTVTLNDRTLLSDGVAKYVVEVNGGYCQKHGIVEGDKIDFEIF